jgi:hypothetical protein
VLSALVRDRTADLECEAVPDGFPRTVAFRVHRSARTYADPPTPILIAHARITGAERTCLRVFGAR